MPVRTFLALALSLSLSAPVVLLAQEEPPPQPEATLFVEQKSDVDAVGKWTLLLPNHESFDRTDAVLEVPDLRPGRYTFMTEAPSGTEASIDLWLGDDVIKHADTPQISFELQDTMKLKLVVNYKLTIYGKIGVNSAPTGMPFELRGPNGLFRRGVTPVELSPMPIGNYSATFKPDGCLEPPPKAGLLTKDGRIDFMLELVCDTFKPAEVEEKDGYVTTEVGNVKVTFTDVPADSWFGPYVATIANLGVMAGYSDKNGKLTGKFGPGDNVTLAQLARIAHTLMKIDTEHYAGAPKNPKAIGQWFTRDYASAEELGWIVYLDPSVDPNRPATRGEVLVTLIQALDLPMQWPKGNVFTDVMRKTPYSGAIETASKEGIVSGVKGADGKETGEFHPLNPVSRAEMAKIAITIRERFMKKSAADR